MTKNEYELRNMITVAQLVAESALNRRESRGAHYRTDFTETLENSVHSVITKKEGVFCFVE